MTKSTSYHVLIIGSGIAGLAAGLSLKKAGIEAVILEASPEPRESSGSFFGLHPNGRDVLKTLGIENSVLKGGVETHEFHFFSQRRSLTKVSTDVMTIERSAVAKAMRLEAISQGVDIQYGKKLTTVAQSKEQVTAVFADGSKADGICLIGADGIHSKTRRVVFRDSPRPYYNGMVRSSAIITNELGIKPTYGTTNMIMGKDAFFSYLVKQDGYIDWFSNRFDLEEPMRGQIEAIPQADWKADLMRLYEGDDPIINSIITTTDANIHKYPVYDMPLIDSWYKDRVCLIGDAAHAPSSKAGQGASVALEDAIIIAKCLRDIPDVAQAFTTFESLRKDRVETLYKKTRKSNETKFPQWTAGSFIADLLLPISLRTSARVTTSMYDFHVDWDEPIEPTEDS